MTSFPTSDAQEPAGASRPSIWGDPDNPPPLRRVIWRWLARASMVGAIVSIVVHLLGGVVATQILIGGERPAGRGLPSGGPVELAIMGEQELKGLEGGAALPDSPSPAAEISAGEAENPSLQLPSGDASTADSEMAALTPGAGSGGGGDIGEGSGFGIGGPGSGGSGGGSTSFFGVEARGTRFLYIVDVSGSMGVGGKIEALRTQLMQSIEALGEGSQFYIIPFSQWATPLGDKKDWTHANDSGKRFARKYIPALRPLDNTNPLPAFQIAFSTRPRPDAIYFMTDGQFDANVADMVVEYNRGLKIPVHCICFVSRESEAMMQRIAKESGGSYKFVEGPS